MALDTAQLRRLRRAVLATFALAAAACNGGGCGSGCSTCGSTPLPGGFPKDDTVPNAASVRLTRPGLDFVQENFGTVAEKALGSATNGNVVFKMPQTALGPAKVCPPANPKPPECEAEIGIGQAKLRINAITPNRVKLDGVLPMRMKNLPASVTIGLTYNANIVLGDPDKGNLCAQKGTDAMAFKEVPINVELPLVTEQRAPRTGYTKVDVKNAVITLGLQEDDVRICDDSGCGFCASGLNTVKNWAFGFLVDEVTKRVKDALAGSFCTTPTPAVTPPCPTGSQPDDPDPMKAKVCNFTGTDECMPALLGGDGRMDLSKALASFSPGTTGGLDYLLASEGDMNPAPGNAGVPNWTPRKPPVSAQDNNKNGITLKMLGGALPQPRSNCVKPVDSKPPTGIPVPQEMLGDTVTPWPQGLKGPHFGFAIAGRFLDHAFANAYNSGLLCMGITTSQLEQLSSGYLSLLAPSIKNLTFEQAPSAAAITTRPGTPPRVTIGGGTDVKSDPLLLVQLDKFTVDFYVWSLDRFVRILTYTADVTVPLNVQTGKDPKTNPNGGLLPVLGDIKLANATASNAELLMEDGGLIAGGITGLVGGIAGQFLGSGFSPIDIQGALKAAGLGLEIPPGGFRKLTSGQDTFVALFANLTPASGAAREEADTRAQIVEKVVDPSAMGLASASRPRFPKLRVAVEGIASRPTEHTFWVDDGPHAAWSTSKELVVDQDAMLLQGKHVLHVSARVVGEMASEDTTPVAIPFTIDTLPPLVSAERAGGEVKVRVHDYVSAESAILVRVREAEGAFGEWSSARSFTVDPARPAEIEVKDEEGNVGRVSLPLRGKADSTIAAAGSGCSCNAGEGDGTSSAALAGLVAVALVAMRRKKRS